MRRLFRRVLRPFAPLAGLLKEAFDSAWAHNISRMAGAMAYFGAFSIAPILVIVISLASLVFGKAATEGLVTQRLTSTFGEDIASFIQSMLAALYHSSGRTLATVLALLALLWASTRIIGAIRGALNDIWGVQGRGGGGLLGFVIGKAIDVGMVIALGLMFLAAMFAFTAINAATAYFSGVVPLPEWVLQILGILFSLAMTALVLTVVFRVLPNIKVRFAYILVGASVTAVLFTIGNFFIGRYLGRTSPGSAFGAAGSLAVIMIWIYYVSYIFIFGAEVTRAYAHRASVKRVKAAVLEATREGQPVEAADPPRPPDAPQRPDASRQPDMSQPPDATGSP
jgi:membrane protein